MSEKISLEPTVDRLVGTDRERLAILVREGFSDAEVARVLGDLGGNRFDSSDRESQGRLRFLLLKRLEDESKHQGLWEFLSQNQIDKDAAMLQLWRGVARSMPAELWPRSFYEEHYFDWFLSRGDPASARAVLKDDAAARHAEVLLFGSIVVALLLSPTGLLPGWLWAVAAYLGSVLYLARLLRRKERERKHSRGLGRSMLLAGQSLVPRLAGAVTVGFLALASGDTLLRWATGRRGAWMPIALAVLTGAYLLVQISGRVSPAPRGRALWRRWAAIYVCGLSHAVAVAVVGYPLVLDALGPAEGTPATGWVEILSLAGYSLFVGVLLHVIWDERPVTRPI